MGVGFIITIILLATLLGVCARQALATMDENAEEQVQEQGEVDHQPSHPNAI